MALTLYQRDDCHLCDQAIEVLAQARAGVQQVQACINGYGERCGNANMASVIANLKLKMGEDVVTDHQLANLTEICHFVSEVANMAPWPQQPYVGASAFAHKAGRHADGRIAFAAHRLRHRVAHGDHFRGVDHFDVQPLSARVRDALPPQFSADALFLADKENSGAQVARRLDCAFNLYGGGVIPTHCINGDGGQHALLKCGQ